jgi:hypothetical protein
MQCPCGHDFVQAALKQEPRNGFALIRDDNYRKVMKQELRRLQADSREEKAKALAATARYVGSAMECPKCGRLTVLKPRTSERVVYRPD